MESSAATPLSYEQAYAELAEIVDSLEANQKSLEEAMALFERGRALAQYCAALLDKAELRIRQVGIEEDASAQEWSDQ